MVALSYVVATRTQNRLDRVRSRGWRNWSAGWWPTVGMARELDSARNSATLDPLPSWSQSERRPKTRLRRKFSLICIRDYRANLNGCDRAHPATSVAHRTFPEQDRNIKRRSFQQRDTETHYVMHKKSERARGKMGHRRSCEPGGRSSLLQQRHQRPQQHQHTSTQAKRSQNQLNWRGQDVNIATIAQFYGNNRVESSGVRKTNAKTPTRTLECTNESERTDAACAMQLRASGGSANIDHMYSARQRLLRLRRLRRFEQRLGRQNFIETSGSENLLTSSSSSSSSSSGECRCRRGKNVAFAVGKRCSLKRILKLDNNICNNFSNLNDRLKSNTKTSTTVNIKHQKKQETAQSTKQLSSELDSSLLGPKCPTLTLQPTDQLAHIHQQPAYSQESQFEVEFGQGAIELVCEFEGNYAEMSQEAARAACKQHEELVKMNNNPMATRETKVNEMEAIKQASRFDLWHWDEMTKSDEVSGPKIVSLCDDLSLT